MASWRFADVGYTDNGSLNANQGCLDLPTVNLIEVTLLIRWRLWNFVGQHHFPSAI
jgi:hypothetical protein